MTGSASMKTTDDSNDSFEMNDSFEFELESHRGIGISSSDASLYTYTATYTRVILENDRVNETLTLFTVQYCILNACHSPLNHSLNP